MAHMIAGYPDRETSLETARALVAGGAALLEIQFPFSDPSADGPAIQAACTEALAAGFKVEEGWRLVETVRREFPAVPVFVMSYASIVVTKGVDAFAARAQQAGVTGLIIPDLAPGADEGLYAAGREHGLVIVPVIVPSVPKDRLEFILGLKPEWVYTAIRAGITGVPHHPDSRTEGVPHRAERPGPRSWPGSASTAPGRSATCGTAPTRLSWGAPLSGPSRRRRSGAARPE